MQESLQIVLRSPRPRPLFTALIISATVVYWVDFVGRLATLAQNVAGLAQVSDRGLLLQTLLGLGLLYLTGRHLRPAPSEQRIFVGDEDVQLPVGQSGRSDRLRYDELGAVSLLGGTPFRVVFISGPRRSYLFQEPDFEKATDIPRLVDALRGGISRRPDGEQRLADIDRRVRFGDVILEKRPRVTEILLILIALVYVVELFAGVRQNEMNLLSLGASSRVLVGDGQLFRLLSANFLHAHIPHLFLNSIGLFSVGGLVERIVGGPRFILIFVFGGAGGALLSVLLSNAPFSVGASTSLYALLGAFWWISTRYNQELPPGIRQSRRWWQIVLGISVALPLLLPQIDFVGHIGGFLAGVALMMVLGRAQTLTTIVLRDPTRTLRIAAVATILLAALSLVQASFRGAEAGPEDIRSVLLRDSSLTPIDLNNFAWTVAIDPAASGQELETAQVAIEAAIERSESEVQFTDTQATLLFRQGATAEAVKLQAGLLPASEPLFGRIVASQLMRFELAHEGPILDGSLEPLSLETSLSRRVAGVRTLTLQFSRGFPRGATIHLLVHNRGVPHGFAVLRVGPRQSGTIEYPDREGAYILWSATASIELGFVQETGGDLLEGAVEFTTYELEKGYLALPGRVAQSPTQN